MEWLASAVASVLAIILALVTRKRTEVSGKVRKAQELSTQALKSSFEAREMIAEGRAYELKDKLDRLHADLRALAVVLDKKNLPTKP